MAQSNKNESVMAHDVTGFVRVVRDALDRAREQEHLAPSDAELRSFFADARTRLEEKRRRARYAGIGLSLASAACAVVLWAGLRPGPLSFSVGEEGERGAENSWIRAGGERDVPLSFSDGSRVEVVKGASARVTELKENGANLMLERGELELLVQPRPKTNWSVVAGPYTVEVVGTVFDVSWEPESETLRVSVERGAVDVRGPVIHEVQRLGANKELVISLPDRRATLRGLGQSEQASLESTVADTKAPDSSTTDGNEVDPKPIRPPAHSDVRAPDWEAQAKRGRYQEALAAADRLGIEQLTSTLSAEKLLRLADVARIGGKPSVAQRILFTLRKRFPGTSSSGLAAYTLGVTAFDQKRSFPEAAGWFSTYLSEQPGGPLSQEALGRLIEALQRSGQSESARSAASRYLKAYPEGIHSELAKRVLDE